MNTKKNIDDWGSDLYGFIDIGFRSGSYSLYEVSDGLQPDTLLDDDWNWRYSLNRGFAVLEMLAHDGDYLRNASGCSRLPWVHTGMLNFDLLQPEIKPVIKDTQEYRRIIGRENLVNTGIDTKILAEILDAKHGNAWQYVREALDDFESYEQHYFDAWKDLFEDLSALGISKAGVLIDRLERLHGLFYDVLFCGDSKDPDTVRKVEEYRGFYEKFRALALEAVEAGMFAAKQARDKPKHGDNGEKQPEQTPKSNQEDITKNKIRNKIATEIIKAILNNKEVGREKAIEPLLERDGILFRLIGDRCPVMRTTVPENVIRRFDNWLKDGLVTIDGKLLKDYNEFREADGRGKANRKRRKTK